ncbi:RING finger protein unkempt isoform X5 [Anoplophora glabripennis]|uniref:RING finger protein unkempt isoform X5 n=1 Tax=Anoplophora glabripennis TaxID=217634 RepID=UPI000874D7E0|nr:RING finger protein unkempt isoform X5 [Anoplophora glabripennis]
MAGSTPCPNVKHGEEWGEPGNCDAGDLCSYCHTRTEQQFHPEIYKSTKCNDVQQSGYCPRGVFCAFAHVEQELGVSRDTGDSGTNLAEILSNALPQSADIKIKEKSSDSSNGCSEVSESSSTSSEIGNSISNLSSSLINVTTGSSAGTSKAPGSQLTHKPIPFQRHTTINLELSNKLMAIEKDPTLVSDAIEREQRKQNMCYAYNNLGGPFYSGSDTVESVVGNALDELNLEDSLNLSGALDRDIDADSPTVSNSISVGLASSAGLLGSSAPVNIPSSTRSGLSGFSPTSNSPLQPFLSATRFSQSDHIDFLNSQMQLSSSASKVNNYPSFFDFQSQSISPSSRNHNNFSMSPSINSNLEVVRLREELASCRIQLNNWEDRLQQARTACDVWQREAEEATRKTQQAESKFNETLSQYNALKQEYESLQGGPHIRSITKVSELSKLSLSVLKNIHAQLRQDLEEIEKVLYRETASKCMVCEERNRTVTLNCNHFVLCDTCASTQDECPYCQTPINLISNI